MLVAALVAALAVGGAVAFVVLGNGGDGPTPTPVPTTTVVVTQAPTPTPTSSQPPTPPPPTASNITWAAYGASASSALDAGGGASYGADNLLDGSTKTCWSEGVGGYGEGEYVDIEFSETVVLTRFELVPGYLKYDSQEGVDRWWSNGRLAELELSFSDGTSESFTLDDRKGWHTFQLDEPHTDQVRMTIVDAFPHTDEWGDHAADDTSVSEVRFYGWPESEEGGY